MSTAAERVDEPATIRSRMRRREIALWLTGFGWPALRVLVLGTLLGLAIVFGMSEMVEPLGDDASPTDVAVLGLRYGLYLSIVPAIWAGLSSLALRLARGWAVIPALTLPLYVMIAAWLRAGVLRSSVDALTRAVNAQLDARSAEMADQIGMPSDGMLPGVEVPMLMARAGDTFFDAPVRAALAVVEREVVFTLIAALVPGLLVSFVALAIGYRRGWEARHEADLERLRRLERPS